LERERLWGGEAVNLLMICDRGDALYSVHSRA
jgi:hypothetical protein